jgi:hypothetical protein
MSHIENFNVVGGVVLALMLLLVLIGIYKVYFG